MKALRLYGIRDLRVDDLPEPEPGPGQVKVRVQAVGLCGSVGVLPKVPGAFPAPHGRLEVCRLDRLEDLGEVVVVPRAGTPEHRSEIVLNPLRAPIRRGEQVGRMELLKGDERIEFVALVAGADVPRMWWVTALRWLLRAGAVLLVGAVAVRTAFRISRRRRRS